MSRYQESGYKEGLDNAIGALDEILDLIKEVKRKNSSKSVHQILDQMTKTADDSRQKAFDIFEKVGR